jgi:hypothetical protein
MAIAVLSDTPNMTTEQYDAVAAEVGLRQSLPDGCSAYLAGVCPDGSAWREISVWDSPNQAEEFMDTVLRPAIERAGREADMGTAREMGRPRADRLSGAESDRPPAWRRR